jgi:hypothetical protein
VAAEPPPDDPPDAGDAAEDEPPALLEPIAVSDEEFPLLHAASSMAPTVRHTAARLFLRTIRVS